MDEAMVEAREGAPTGNRDLPATMDQTMVDAHLAQSAGIVYATNMSGRRIVLDTNVVVAALRSRRGASFRLLGLVGTGRFSIVLSVPLVLEYEDALSRSEMSGLGLSSSDIADVLDYLCSVAVLQPVFFLWRPRLRDPRDDMVLEVAMAAGCHQIVTFNLRDFKGIEDLGITAITPRDLLEQLGELR